MSSPSLSLFLTRLRKPEPEGVTLSFDPGITTGWAAFSGTRLVEGGQFKGTDLIHYHEMVERFVPKNVVCESYRVYAHRAAQHVGSDVPTVQIIGAIKLVCSMCGTPLHLQAAYQAKGFVDDARLKELGLYQEGLKHANDAIRHAVYWFLFGQHRHSTGES